MNELSSPLEGARKIAQKAGVENLRPAQEDALTRLFAGENLLLIWPTGSGKSLCYQLPALVKEGRTVVISPLIALMDDQVGKARAVGWPVTCIHSGLSREERESRLRQVERGDIKLLYVTPERFRHSEFSRVLSGLSVSLLAVDEAHCISQWGHDFRPDYSRLGEIREKLGRPQVIALTATATREVQTDILLQLGLNENSAKILWEGVERPNLFLAARECEHEDDKWQAAREWLDQTSGAKIIYFTLISTLQRTAEKLKAPHLVYHGDLDDRLRRRNLKQFLAGEADLMLATPAFGLGVDKPDIRGILHFEVPGSLESYYQEVGRAGRDGQPSRCKLLYSQNDLETQMRFIESLTPEPAYVRAVDRLLTEWEGRLNVVTLDDMRAQLSFKNKRDFRLETALSFLDRLEVIHWPHRQLKKLRRLRELGKDDLDEELWLERKKSLQRKLLNLVQWFRASECRKVGIYRYFGWPHAEPCGFCDHCEAGR